MPNILLTRIDNRLVHGQVGVTWTKTIGANLLLVANDEASQDKISLEKTAAIIGRAAPNQKIFIVAKTPQDVRTLIDKGVPIKEVNVGNMHFSEGKHQLTKKVYVDDQDMEDLKYISSKGVHVYIQDVPGDVKTEI